jgi:hypothetical protein
MFVTFYTILHIQTIHLEEGVGVAELIAGQLAVLKVHGLNPIEGMQKSSSIFSTSFLSCEALRSITRERGLNKYR